MQTRLQSPIGIASPMLLALHTFRLGLAPGHPREAIAVTTAPRSNGDPYGRTLRGCVEPEVEEELERQADRLLWRSRKQQGPGDYPFHPESYIAATAQGPREDEAVLEFAPPWNGPPSRELLTRVRRGLRTADLRPLERRVLDLCMRGMMGPSIARRLGITRKAVSGHLLRARRKVASAARGKGPRRDPCVNRLITEVYREEVERPRYLPIEHCPPGREACRGDGLCNRRPYLFYPFRRS
jgi:DNA-binding CsgD family transcriptional regulator